MLAILAAALAASSSTPILEPAVPWWERVTVTFDDKGTQQSCMYQFSLIPGAAATCNEEMASSIKPRAAQPQSGVFSKLTFERRFSPGGKLDSGKLQPGDKLLGQQVLFMTIDAEGSIGSCKVLATSGDLIPAYDCDALKTEQFRALASASTDRPREAFMTIMVYGHQEQIA